MIWVNVAYIEGEKSMKRYSQFEIRIESFLIVLFYSIVLVKDCFLWAFRNENAFWIRICVICISFVYIVFALRKENTRIAFIHLTAMDMLAMIFIAFLFIAKMPFADHAWDTVNYHIYQQEALLRNPVEFDFMPSRTINTNVMVFSDSIFKMSREILGYRLGTIPTFVVMLVSYLLTKRLLYIVVPSWKEACISLVALIGVCSDSMLLLLGLYYVDTLATPLILEAIYIIIAKKGENCCKEELLWLGYIAGLAVSIKLSNAFIVICLALLYLFLNWRSISLAGVSSAAIAACVPLAVYMIRGYVYTGNPLFPYANSLFKSQWFVTDQSVNSYARLDVRFGPETIAEYIFWPFYALKNPARMGDESYYTGRLAITFIAWLILSAICMLRREGRKELHIICTIYGLFYLIYITFMEGYLRYINVIDILGIVLMAGLIKESIKDKRNRASQMCCCFLWSLLFVQTIIAGYNYLFDYGDLLRRESIVTNINAWKKEARLLLLDRESGVSSEIQEEINAWVIADYNSAYAVLVDPTAPIIGVGADSATTDALVELRKERYWEHNKKGMYSIANGWVSDRVVQSLNAEGFSVTEAQPLVTNYTQGFDLMLLECQYEDNAILRSDSSIIAVNSEVCISDYEMARILVCMSAHSNMRYDENRYMFSVYALDENKNRICQMSSFELAYQDKSIEIIVDSIRERGIHYIEFFPHESINAGLFVITKEYDS